MPEPRVTESTRADLGFSGPEVSTPELAPEDLLAKLAASEQARQRVQADYENFRRRTNASFDQALTKGAASFAESILPALDALDAALEHFGADSETLEILDPPVRLLRDSLLKVGLTKFAQVGDSFDPALHDAVEMVASGTELSGRICELLRAGYVINGILLRPAMVRVGA